MLLSALEIRIRVCGAIISAKLLCYVIIINGEVKENKNTFLT